jgi:prepilin-type N-terminal cleavage/methylation domain-containing protein
MKASKGFTLIELLVVIAIIGILASMVIVSLTGARVKSRDGKRLAELKEMQKALELYYSNNGYYPVTSTTCNGNSSTWTSFDSASYKGNTLCVSPSNKTSSGKTLAQEMDPFMRALSDPKPTGANDAGYLYQSASNGQGYCFMSFRNPEDLTNYPAGIVNPGRCGSGNSTAQCSAAGTQGGSTNSIFIGAGSYLTSGC